MLKRRGSFADLDASAYAADACKYVIAAIDIAFNIIKLIYIFVTEYSITLER